MAVYSSTYRNGLSSVSGLSTIITIASLNTLIPSSSGVALVDIFSWAIWTSNPSVLDEFTSFDRRQLLIKKVDGVLSIVNIEIIQEIKVITGGLDIVWSEQLSSNDLLLQVDVTGLEASVFRRAYLRRVA